MDFELEHGKEKSTEGQMDGQTDMVKSVYLLHFVFGLNSNYLLLVRINHVNVKILALFAPPKVVFISIIKRT